MMISVIRQRLFKPRSRDPYHPIKFFDRTFAHVAKHRTPMMKDHLQIRHLSFTNNKFGLHLIHQTNVMPWVDGLQVQVPRRYSSGGWDMWVPHPSRPFAKGRTAGLIAVGRPTLSPPNRGCPISRAPFAQNGTLNCQHPDFPSITLPTGQ